MAEIQQAIFSLPEVDFRRLHSWIGDVDWERWDSRLEADSESGTLEFLVDEALDPGELRPLDDTPTLFE